MRIEYRILTTHGAEPSEVIAGLQDLAARVTELSGRASLADGRPFGDYIARQLSGPARTRARNRGRGNAMVYVATAPGSEGRAIHGRGFRVERVVCDDNHTPNPKGGVA
jgi:hypothetical protein